MAIDDSGKGWQERLTMACTWMAETEQEESHHFRREAEQAPLEELRIFLNRQPGPYEGHARAVMSEVLRQREDDIAEEASRRAWWRGLLQQTSAGVLVTAAVSAAGFLLSWVWLLINFLR